jgi:hypothetical protein
MKRNPDVLQRKKKEDSSIFYIAITEESIFFIADYPDHEKKYRKKYIRQKKILNIL